MVIQELLARQRIRRILIVCPASLQQQWAEEPIDARVIAATNRPVHEWTGEGGFRRDLLYRFGPPIVVPPLRERREEILVHARRQAEAAARRHGLRLPDFTSDAREFLVRHPWPGNVRQLENVVANAAVLCDDGKITGSLLEALAGSDGTAPEAASWRELRQRNRDVAAGWARALVSRHGGVVEAAARTSGCPPTTLRRFLRQGRDVSTSPRAGGSGDVPPAWEHRTSPLPGSTDASPTTDDRNGRSSPP